MALAINQGSLISLATTAISDYPFALLGWFRVPNVAKLLSLMSVQNSTTGSNHRLYYEGNSTLKVVATSFVVNPGTARSAITMTTNQWHHVVGVFESDANRRVYLDGGNMGASFNNRDFDGAHLLTLGNSLSTDAIDAADCAVITGVPNANQIAQLARGMSVLTLPIADQILAYQSCVRGLNWPALGPPATSSTAAGVIAHPRVFAACGGCGCVMPNRVGGPFYLDQRELCAGAVSGADVFNCGATPRSGQFSVAGVVADEFGFRGEVLN